MRSAIGMLIALAASLPAPAHAQEAVTAHPHTRPEPEAPAAAPPVVARPDLAIRDGGVSVGSLGKIVASRAVELSPGLRSSFEASVNLDSPGERALTPGIRKGLVRVSLQSVHGLQGTVGLWGDSKSQTLSASAASVLSPSIQLNAAATSSWSRYEWGDLRVGYGSLGLGLRAPAGFVVQPALHVVDVDALSDQRWYGTSWRVDGRGVEARMDHDFGRRRWWMLRKNWRRSVWRATLGAQLLERTGAANHRLLEIGAGAGGITLHWYPAQDQQAVLLGVGPVQVGYGRRLAQRQLVLGVGNLSLSRFESPEGPVFGLGFVFHNLARHVSRTAQSWRWEPTLHESALQEPHVRWPGFATNLD